MRPEIERAFKRADERLVNERCPMIIYRRNNRVAVIPYATFLDADLDSKGAKRIAVRTINAKGKIV